MTARVCEPVRVSGANLGRIRKPSSPATVFYGLRGMAHSGAVVRGSGVHRRWPDRVSGRRPTRGRHERAAGDREHVWRAPCRRRSAAISCRPTKRRRAWRSSATASGRTDSAATGTSSAGRCLGLADDPQRRKTRSRFPEQSPGDSTGRVGRFGFVIRRQSDLRPCLRVLVDDRIASENGRRLHPDNGHRGHSHAARERFGGLMGAKLSFSRKGFRRRFNVPCVGL